MLILLSKFWGAVQYSSHVFESLIAETKAEFPEIEKFLYGLVGSEEIISQSQLLDHFERLNIASISFEKMLELLCDATFLGLEVRPNEFEMIYDDNRKKIIYALAQNLERNSAEKRYSINKPFHNYMEIK